MRTASLFLALFSFLFVFRTNAQSFAWVQRTGGTAGDIGWSVTVDGTGNVYTAAIHGSTTDFDPGPGTFNLTGFGLGITKLDASGNFVFAKNISGAASARKITLDASGNILVAGTFYGTVDFDPSAATFNLTSTSSWSDLYVLKLDASGNFLWAVRLGGTGGQTIDPLGMITDNFGNVYATGFFEGAMDFDPGAGVSTMTTAGFRDMFTMKLDASGNFVWSNRIGSYNNVAEGHAICFDQSHIYITGYFSGTMDLDPGAGTFSATSAGNDDVFVQQFDLAGNLVWVKTMGGTGQDRGEKITIDVSGDLLYTGYFDVTADFDPGPGVFNLVETNGYVSTFISKLTNAGNLVWAKGFSGGSVDIPTGITTDASGNVYTTGRFGLVVDFDPGPASYDIYSNGINDVFVSKLDASGNFVSAKAFGGTGDDIAWDIAVDVFGSVYTIGYFVQTVDFNTESGVFLQTAAGNTQPDIFLHKLLACSSVPATPGTITGDPVVCTGSTHTYSIAPVAGAVSYTWTLPSGWTGTSATDSITVTAGTSGNLITVTANNACGASSPQSLNVSVSHPALGLTPFSPSCNSICDASITATAAGGFGPYTFSPATLTNLCAGSYTVTVTDSYGCTAQQTTTITQPAVLTASITTMAESGLCNGSATVIASGGTSGYTYLWNDPSAQTTATAGALCTGYYCVTVTDANGCTVTACDSVDTTVGIDVQTQESGVTIFPNPNDGTFFLELDQQEAILVMTDVSGRFIESRKLYYGTNQVEMHLPAGVYFARVMGGKEERVIKMVVR